MTNGNILGNIVKIRYDNVRRKPLKTKKNVTIGLPKSASRGLGMGK